MKIQSMIVLVLMLSGCATVPKENPITVTVNQPVAVAQFTMETVMRESAPATQVKTQTEHMLVLTNDCMNVPQMDAFKCSMVMMAIGNTGWSGPYHIQTYRFVNIDGKTNVRGDWQWCAVNGFGKENCSQINPNASNKALILLERRLSPTIATNGATH